jgi:hypothetical protein
VASEEQFLAETTDDVWEIGASGIIYDRSTVLGVLLQRWSVGEDEADTERWTTTDHCAQLLAAENYLFTYNLHQNGRTTRRTTIWQRTAQQQWQARFHQGTSTQQKFSAKA